MSEKVFKLLTGTIIISFLGFLIWWGSNIERVEIGATVLSHAVTTKGRDNNNRVYITIIKRDDGVIQELTGLKYYVLSEGSRVVVIEYK